MNEFKLSAWRLLAAASLTLLIAGCNNNSPTQTGTSASTTVSDETVLRRGNDAEPGSLDPHLTTGTQEGAILFDLYLGLTTPDNQGRPIAGAAERWETSADGLTWTFHLRDHTWTDGTPVTADDFIYGWRRILDPKTAAPYASILYVFKNAEVINTGKMPPEQLGARAVDSKTLVLTLETPAPYLPELMMHPTTFPLQRNAIETYGKDWTKPANYVSNGAYTLSEWIPNDHVTLVKNPKFYDAANVKIDRVVFFPTSNPDAALKRFRAGEIDTLSVIPAEQIGWVKANMGSMYQVRPYLATGYYVINLSHKPFDDIRVREALNLAYDRDTIAYKLLPFGEPPSYSIVPPGTDNYPGNVELSFKSMPYPDRVKRAQALMEQAGFGPDKRLKLKFLAISSNDAKRVAAAAQQMWRAIYVDADIVQVEPHIHSVGMQSGDFDVAPYGWVGDFNDARNFLFLALSNNALNYARYKNPQFDALIKQSDTEQDLMKRGALMAQAEAILLKDSPWIPTRFQVTSNLVEPYVKGWISNITNFNPTRWLSIEKPAAAQ